MKINYANRGKGAENLVEYFNDRYSQKGYGVVQKIATPSFISNGNIFRLKSTVDYIGFLNGKGVAFDVKECNQKSFSLANIQGHQVEFLVQANKGGAYSFILLNWVKKNEFWVIPITEIIDYQQREQTKTINYKTTKINYFNLGNNPDYIKCFNN